MTFLFFQSSGASPDHRYFSQMIKSCLTVEQASSFLSWVQPVTCHGLLSVQFNIPNLTLLCCSLPFYDSLLASRYQGLLKVALINKDQGEKGTEYPDPFHQQAHIFHSSPIPLEVLLAALCLSCHLARFIFRWALVFLLLSIHASMAT